jgi:hypothetical protein
MNMYLDEQLVRDRLRDDRAIAAQSAMVQRLRPTRLPVRMALGLALIRAGYWVAGRDPRRAGQPRRAIA